MDTWVAPAVVVGFLALAALLGLLVRLVSRLSAPRVSSGPATPDLIDTPPAVVNLLVNGLRGAPEAAPATLLDLAARDYLDLHQPGPDPADTIVKVRRGVHPGLAAYEARVLERVDVPPGVRPLTLGDLARRQAEDGQSWHGRLVEAAREDAVRRGLIGTGKSSVAMGLLVVGLMFLLVVSCGAGAAVVHLAGLTERLGSNGAGIMLLVVAFVLMMTAIFVSIGLAGDLRDERLTPEGRRVARHWAGVGRWLRAHEAFADLPPASVTVWDAYLAHGVALGAAPRAAATVDLRVGLVDVVRAPAGDRLVRIRYPATGGLKATRAGTRIVVAVLGIGLVAGIGAIVTRDVPDEAVLPIAAVAALPILRWVYRILRALADLLVPARITGRVLRIVPFGTFGDAESTVLLSALYESPLLSWLTRRTGAPAVTSDGTGLVPGFFVVVDDGTSGEARAWRARPRNAGALRPGDVVTAKVERWTRSLIDATAVPHSGIPADAAARY